MGTLLMAILLIFLIGTIPSYRYSQRWGYAPSAFLGLLAVVLLELIFMGAVPWFGWTLGPGPRF